MLPTPLRKESPRVVPKSEFDYLSVVGSLLHIANCVRCDISYAVGNLARFSAAPGPAHVLLSNDVCNTYTLLVLLASLILALLVLPEMCLLCLKVLSILWTLV